MVTFKVHQDVLGVTAAADENAVADVHEAVVSEEEVLVGVMAQMVGEGGALARTACAKSFFS